MHDYCTYRYGTHSSPNTDHVGLDVRDDDADSSHLVGMLAWLFSYVQSHTSCKLVGER